MAEVKFREKWLEAIDKKNSVLCAGLDPAEFEMGRKEKGLPDGCNKKDWAMRYVASVNPYCAAIKPNLRYWAGQFDSSSLQEVIDFALSLGLVVIQDSKEADIGSTNDSGIFYAQERKVDAVTFSPFAGNLEEAVGQAHKRGLGLISMCLMSNPEFKREKNKWVNVEDDWRTYYVNVKDLKLIKEHHARQYVQLAHDARKFEVDGIVIGAPSEKNHIKEEEIETVGRYVGDDMLVLLPGLGAQGGEAEKIWKYFSGNKVIVNVGRSLMLPNGSNSTPEQQAETAKQYRDMLNELRGA